MGLFVPALTPFTFHWYAGARPPFVGVAVKATAVPAQISLEDGETETLTGSKGLTVIVTVFELAGFPVGQVAFDVSTQVTVLLLAGA